MLDSDLASLYQVETKALKQAVKRNIDRFPEDFMFELAKEESEFLRLQIVTLEKKTGINSNLRSQIVTSSWGGSRYQNFVFTEQGVAMLSSVLRSDTAVKVNIQIMRAFCINATNDFRVRRIIKTNRRIGRKYGCSIFRSVQSINTDSK